MVVIMLGVFDNSNVTLVGESLLKQTKANKRATVDH